MFSNPTRVSILGYTGDAMEPFLSPDGEFLFFNNSNVDPTKTQLFFATKVDKNNFQFVGPVNGANLSGILSAVASVDERGNFYFISLRSYSTDFNTLYGGFFNSGVFAGLYEVVDDFNVKQPGVVVSDASVGADGQTMVYTREVLGESPAAFLYLANKHGDSFVTDPNSEVILQNVNAAGLLTYAGDLSSSGLVLYYSQSNPTLQIFQILMSTRSSLLRCFGPPAVILATGATNAAEAPTISPDGSTLYYHQLVNGVYEIFEMSK